jgi:putative NIF3 family GTP cyclohydrolase 1 type 2
MPITVQDILDKLMEPVHKIQNTVDTLKAGEPATEVKGIATAFMATHQVIEQTIALGANLLITHEGIYSTIPNTWKRIRYIWKNVG